MAMKCEPVKVKKILCFVKFFACLMLSIGELMEENSLKLKFRSLSCFVKTLKSCIDEKSMSLAQKIQEHADREYQVLESINENFDKTAKSEFIRNKIELFIIKMQISIIEGDIEMAKLYEERCDLSNNEIDSKVILETSRIIFNTCLNLYEKKNYENVIYFLNKIVDKVNSIDDIDSKSIKCSIFSLLAKSCFELKTNESLKIASNSIQLLKNIDSTSLDSFKFDIKLKRLQSVHTNEIEQSIIQMLMSVPIISNFKSILSIINEHSNSDPLSAIKCFEFTMTNKLDPETDQDALEMLLIAMINAYIKDLLTPIDIKHEKLFKFFDISEKLFIKPICKKTSSTAVTLLWTTGKKELKNNNFEDAIHWFELILHRMIQVNEDDKSKTQRALQNCYINIENYDEALKIYELMNDEGKKSLITQYNLFKIYMEINDEIKLMKSLKKISESNEKIAIPLLSLCAINTKSNSRIAIESMLKLFKKIKNQNDLEISISKTVRCVIELILKESNELFEKEYTNTLLTLFDEAFKFANDTIHVKNYKFSNDELKWFASKSFNISRNCLINEDYVNGEMISQISINFNNLIIDNISIEESLRNKIWSFRAKLIEIMCTSKLTNISSEILWNSIRNKSLNLRVLIDEIKIVNQNRVEFDKVENEFKECLMDVTLFQFQSELELSNWSSATTIVNECMNIRCIEFDSTLINILVDEKYPDMIKSTIISIIIEKNISNYEIEGIVLARWLRLLLKTSNGFNESEQACLKIIDKIIQRIRSSNSAESKLPSHEIEWLSSTCWNNGVNKMFNEDRINGKNWCELAIGLSNFVNERFEKTLIKLWDELSTSV